MNAPRQTRRLSGRPSRWIRVAARSYSASPFLAFGLSAFGLSVFGLALFSAGALAAAGTSVTALAMAAFRSWIRAACRAGFLPGVLRPFFGVAASAAAFSA